MLTLYIGDHLLSRILQDCMGVYASLGELFFLSACLSMYLFSHSLSFYLSYPHLRSDICVC